MESEAELTEAIMSTSQPFSTLLGFKESLLIPKAVWLLGYELSSVDSKVSLQLFLQEESDQLTSSGEVFNAEPVIILWTLKSSREAMQDPFVSLS